MDFSISDKRLLSRAIREKWNIPPQTAQKVILMASDTLDATSSPLKDKIEAGKLLVGIERMVLRSQIELMPKEHIHTHRIEEMSEDELIKEIKQVENEMLRKEMLLTLKADDTEHDLDIVDIKALV